MLAKRGGVVWTAFLLAMGLSSALILGIELRDPTRERFWHEGGEIFAAVVITCSSACLLAFPTWAVLRTRPAAVTVGLMLMAIPIYLALVIIGGVIDLLYGGQLDMG